MVVPRGLLEQIRFLVALLNGGKFLSEHIYGFFRELVVMIIQCLNILCSIVVDGAHDQLIVGKWFRYMDYFGPNIVTQLVDAAKILVDAYRDRAFPMEYGMADGVT